MRHRLSILILVLGSWSCQLGASGGVYRVTDASGAKRTAWSAGISAGYYVGFGDTRVSVSRGFEASAPTEGPVTSYYSALWTARIDQRLARLLRLTAVAGMENSASAVVEGMDGGIDYDTGKTRFLFAGPTFQYQMLMLSAGPAYLRWATNEMGTTTSIGGQLRMTFAFNLQDIAESPSLFDGVCGRFCQAMRSVQAPRSVPSGDGKYCNNTIHWCERSSAMEGERCFSHNDYCDDSPGINTYDQRGAYTERRTY